MIAEKRQLAQSLDDRITFAEQAPGSAYRHALANALRAVLAVHQPEERDPVCGRSECVCSEPKVQCSCTAHHDDWPDAYPCSTVLVIAASLGVSA